MSCRKQHFIFITKVETGVSVQNQNISVAFYPHVDKMSQFLDVLPSLTETRVSYPSHFVAHVVPAGVRVSNDQLEGSVLGNDQ